MTWYNPISWFKKNNIVVNLICDNPYCGEEIKERDVMYDRKRDRVYHDKYCAKIDMAFLSAQSHEHVYGKIEHISRKRVVNIRKANGLESSVSEDNSVILK